MTGKHRKPTLVRAWTKDYTQLPSAFVDWEEAGGYARFGLPADHDLAPFLYDRSVAGFGVESASAVEWMLDTWTRDDSGWLVTCISREAQARLSILSDEYLIWLWLDAEQRYLADVA